MSARLFILRPVSLACKWLSSSVVFHMVPLCVVVCILIPCSYKETSHIGLGFTLTTHFNLIISSKVFFSNSHILRCFWWLRLHIRILGGDAIHLTTNAVGHLLKEDFKLSGIWEEKCFGPSHHHICQKSYLL